MEEPQVGDVYNVSLGFDHRFIAVTGVTETEAFERCYLGGQEETVETVDVISVEIELLDGIHRDSNNRQLIVDYIEQGWVIHAYIEDRVGETINTEEHTVEVSLTLD